MLSLTVRQKQLFTSVLVPGIDDKGTQRLGIACHTIERWSADNGCEFSAKTDFCYSQPPRQTLTTLPRLYGVIISICHIFNILRVALDSHLSMRRHVHVQSTK